MSGGRPVLVIADDLTGGNATAAGFARAGLRAVTVGPGRPVATELTERFDAVVVSTGSRHCPPAEAAERVATAVRAGWPATLVCHRIDSTLRGNVGASTAAVLRAVREASGRRTVALCAPAHPAAGRHTVQGTQLLDGVRLEETELAHDPRSPLPTSDVAALIRRQADLRVAHLPLREVTGDAGALRRRMRTLVAGGAEVVVADALTTGHLHRVAAAAVAAAGGGGGDAEDVVWIGVDPGPASVALAEALGLTRCAGGAPLLAVSGSTTRLTRVQLARLRAEHRVATVRTAAAGRCAVPDVDATAAALGEALAAAGSGDVVLLATALDSSDVVETSPDDAARLPVALARTVRRVLERHPVSGLFSTGGDVSAALLAELGAHGLDVEEELVPLAVAGTVVGGPWDGLPVVTKGGLVGGTETTVACVEHLGRVAAAARRRVRSVRPRTAPHRPQGTTV